MMSVYHFYDLWSPFGYLFSGSTDPRCDGMGIKMIQKASVVQVSHKYPTNIEPMV